MTTFNFFSPDFRKMRGIPCGTSDEPLVSHRLQNRRIFSFTSLSKARSASHARREKREKKLTPASVPSSRVTHNSRSPPFTKKRKQIMAALQATSHVPERFLKILVLN